MRIASFNLQNLRLRHEGGHPWIEGARDRDAPDDASPEARLLDPLDRRLTAEVLRDIDADVVALQEVFDSATLDFFHDRFLLPAGLAPYPQRICLPGNDGRGLDVALLSRLPVQDIRSHARLTPRDLGLPDAADPDRPLFRRDCLMASIGRLTLVICHFKAPSPDAAAAWPIRRMEASAVRRLIEQRFAAEADAYWLILGDLNEPRAAIPPIEPAIAPLAGGFSVDLMARLPEAERWTFLDRPTRRHTCPDALLASPALARDWPDAQPVLVREGMGREAGAADTPRLGGVGRHRPHASDHAAVVIDFAGL